jgi:hypothetical protein
MSNIDLGVWEHFKGTINQHLQNDDINTFYNWPVLQQTMVAGVDEVEFNHLNQSPWWPIWSETLHETALQPNSYNRFPSSSTNNMHHAYSLDVMMQQLNTPLNEFGIVIEFGAGYGNTCRLFKKWGHDKTYIIYDIPELISIQKHYFGANNITDVNYLSGLDGIAFQQFEVNSKNSLFLGLWSISETPRHERKALLEQLGFYSCDNIFLAMGGTFYNENNLEWLNEEVIPRLEQEGYTHKLIPIAHGSDMWYFVAQKG